MRQNNRETILKTARKLFLQHGFNGVSIRMIASGADLTTGAVYFHFKNKKDIYTTICFEAIDLLIDRFKQGIDARETPPQKLISTFDSFMSFYEENREHYNLLMEYKSHYESDTVTDRDEIAIRFTELLRIMARTVDLGREASIFRDVDSEKLSLLLGSIAEGMLQYRKLGIFDAMDVGYRDFRSFMSEIVGNGILKK